MRIWLLLGVVMLSGCTFVGTTEEIRGQLDAVTAVAAGAAEAAAGGLGLGGAGAIATLVTGLGGLALNWTRNKSRAKVLAKGPG